MCLFRRAWHVFLTRRENRTQRGPLALNYIRVGILARCRTSGWLFKPKLNSHFSWAEAFQDSIHIPKCPRGCSVGTMSGSNKSSWNKTNTFTLWFGGSRWLMAALSHCFLLKQQYKQFSTFPKEWKRKWVSAVRQTLGLYSFCANLEGIDLPPQAWLDLSVVSGSG